MKRLFVMISLALLLAGCSLSGGEYLEYTGDAFSASIEGNIGGFIFTADVKIGAPRASDGSSAPLPRDLELIFRAPGTLSGVRAERKDGKITVTSGGMSIESSGAAGWLKAAELLIPDGNVNDVETINENGARIAEIEIALEDGDILMIYVDCETGFPVRAVCKDIEILVAGFGEASN
jgi:hypothetical protein